jgi:hypothetical protein
MTSTECTNWLADYQINGAYHADAGQHRTCANCGQGIANIAVATHRHTGETVTLGLDCAERAGLNTAALRAMLAEKYAQQRATARYAATAPERAARAAREAEQQARWAAEAAAEAAERATMTVEDWALTDLDGNFIPAKILRGKYGLTWLLLDTWGGDSTGTFIAAHPKRATTMEAKGYREVRALFPIAGPTHKPWADTDRQPVAIVTAED